MSESDRFGRVVLAEKLARFRLIKCTLAQALHVTASYSVSETSSFFSSSSEY